MKLLEFQLFCWTIVCAVVCILADCTELRGAFTLLKFVRTSTLTTSHGAAGRILETDMSKTMTLEAIRRAARLNLKEFTKQRHLIAKLGNFIGVDFDGC